ncbi:unnamed protein product [Absidia cylindrospora]
MGQCRSNVNGYSGAKFKKFNTMEEAEAFASSSPLSSNDSYSLRSNNYERPSYYDNTPAPRSNYQRPSYSSYHNYDDDDDTPTYNPSPRTYKATPARIPVAIKPTTFASTSNYSTKRKRDDDQGPVTTSKAIKSESKGGKVVYTDGASRGNGRVGAKAGYGIWWGDGDARNLSGSLEGERQTNQRAEATAILKVLEQTQNMNHGLEIRTNSQYCIKAMTKWNKTWQKNNWKSSTGKDVQNKDLFEPMLNLVKSRKGETKFVYVPGHSGVHGNEQADALAVAGAESNVKKEE